MTVNAKIRKIKGILDTVDWLVDDIYSDMSLSPEETIVKLKLIKDCFDDKIDQLDQHIGHLKD